MAMATLRFVAALLLGLLALNSVEGRYDSFLTLHGSRRGSSGAVWSALAPLVDHRQQLRLDNGLAATPPMG